VGLTAPIAAEGPVDHGDERPSVDRHQGQDGFTLVELMITVFIAGIMGAAILAVFVSSLHVFASEGSRVLSQDGARTGAQQMARYLRGAASSVSNQTTTSDAIAVANPQEVVFYCDASGDGRTEKVRYYLSGTELRMQTAAPNMATNPPTYPAYQTTSIVCTGVVNGPNPVFTYYNYDDANKRLVAAALSSPPTATQLADIVGVGIDLNINEQPKLAPSGARLMTTIQIRQRYNGGL
jgi:prepilin-type N-terminal cleavage/methylation domain-containing protein